jgi:superfamily II DNA or RNA helicase
MSNYVGKKGYTLLKSSLTQREIIDLKNDLWLKPQINGKQFIQNQIPTFPVYRENDNKLYIPRFYGIEKYGLPEKTEIDEGININVEFTKELRDYQHNIVNIYMKHVESGSGGGILEVPCGRGKTVIALYIISLLKKKTLILVHKEFLMNQWIERIKEFVPGAKVGKIQAQICDIEDKDIVIGMIQTMYTKTYDQSVYSQFGLTVIDEVHRIGSEEFSKTLLKTITPYMLGISATVERKDKLTRLLYMFIGPKIYSETRSSGDTVCVRAFDYVTNDDDFNTVEKDFRGQVKYSTMMSKLCEYGRRSDFIVKILDDLIKENPSGQIMVLAHYKSILKYLFDKITHMDFASVGYYIGGMKQKDLEISETKQIVIATYAMAAEALDIKSLSRLVMATPKSDIIQSVGRILRVKHDNPIIIDIVDNHDCFQNQWINRRRFYKRSNYLIKKSGNDKYTSFDDESWETIYIPKASH